MSHSDDNGLNLPSAAAPYHIVIIPILRGKLDSSILDYCNEITVRMPADIRAFVDKRDDTPQNKKWAYVRKGVPFILEIGEHELRERAVFFTRRLALTTEKQPLQEFASNVSNMLLEHDAALGQACEQRCKKRLKNDVQSLDELLERFSQDGIGFVTAKWCGREDNMERLKDVAVTIRCLPLEQTGTTGKCILTGETSVTDAIFAKSY
jgi:prolyl-tRNA synthetase